ncbi:glycoside hydrolase family 6 protein [Nonomuraea sp. NPDC050556]|uniref:glycoside hydrolase family 6 protein n=1 Tax=Nonomuraea sp. NPDC050556 TaxID=3364369 RepID=UPI0037B203F4
MNGLHDGSSDGLHDGDPRRIGAYTVVARLGAGGMGVVYLAESEGGERVAVKVIHARMAADPDFRRRFAREVAAARRVARFCTAAVLDADVDGELAYLVTEYVEGPSLAETVKESGPLRGSALDGLAASIAMALRAIHGAGVVHRDLKPGNVLLSRVGPKVIDFGVAQLADGELTSTIVGTPAYMSPEQVGGGAITPASDVFSWGCVVAYAASGASPFSGGSVPNVLYRIAHATPDLTALPPSLRPLVERALSKDPAARPTAEDLLNNLSTLAEPDPEEPQAALPGAGAASGGTAEPGALRTAGSRKGRRWWVGGTAVVIAVATAILLTHPWTAGDGETAPTPGSTVTKGNPLLADDVKLWSPPFDLAREQADQWQTTRPADAALMRKLADIPYALWLSGPDLSRLPEELKSAQGVPVFVTDYLPHADCSDRGAKDTTTYLTWIKDLATKLGDAKAVVIMEPNALQRIPGTPSCPTFPGTEQERLKTISDAVRELKEGPNTAVYLDGGQDGWPELKLMTDRLTRAGVGRADGFHLNTSGYQDTPKLIAYGKRLSAQLNGKHFVLDTARNGRGEWNPGDTYKDPMEWCNPPGRGMGERPSTRTADPLVDAYLWITEPGVSYGPCERDGKPDTEHSTKAPPDGQWWNELALERAKLANPPLD